MAKISENMIPDINADWGLDASNNLPYSGEAVQEFIKRTLKQKYGYFHYDENNNRYLVFADESSKELYDKEGDVSLILGTFDAPAAYTIEVELQSGIYNSVLSGSTGNLLRFKFITKKSTSEFPEAYKGAITITNGGVKKSIPLAYGYSEGINGVTLNIDNYLLDGTNTVTISLKGETSGAATTSTAIYNVIKLGLRDENVDISKVYNSGDILTVPVTVNGMGTKMLQWWIDGVEQDFDSTTDRITSPGETPIIKTFVLDGFEPGVHSVQYRVWVESNGQQFNSPVLFRNFFVSGGNDPLIGVAAELPIGVVESGTTLSKLYGLVQYIPYNLRYAIYDPEARSSNNVDVFINNKLYITTNAINGSEEQLTIVINDSGDSDLQLKLYDTVYNLTADVAVSNIDIEEIPTNVLELRARGRNNNPSPDRDKWVYNDITSTFEGFYWNSQSGWNDNSLIINNGAKLTINYAPLSIDWTRSTFGATFEFEFATKNVQDENSPILSLVGDNGQGIEITASEAKMSASGDKQTVSTKFKSGVNNRITFVINPVENVANKNLLFIYVNGVICGAINYKKGDTVLSDSKMVFGGKADIILKHIRFYDKALTSAQILNNYILYRDEISEMIDIYTRNDIRNAQNDIDPEKIKRYLPVMYFTCLGDENANIPWLESQNKSEAKDYQIFCDIEYVDLADEKRNFTIKHARTRLQGTSSIQYPKKNWRFYSKPKEYEGVVTEMFDYKGNVIPKGKYSFKPNAIPVDCWCLKADYAESSSSHNTGTAKFWNNLLTKAEVTYTNVNKSEHYMLYGVTESGEEIAIHNYWDQENSKLNKNEIVQLGITEYLYKNCSRQEIINTGLMSHAVIVPDIPEKLTVDSELFVIKSYEHGAVKEHVLRTNAQNAAIDNGYQYDVRTAIDGFPIVVFYRLNENSDWIFLGKHNFNNDKSTESVFGFCDIPGFDDTIIPGSQTEDNPEGTTYGKKMQCWELTNNNNELGFFTTVDGWFDTKYNSKGEPIIGWEEAFEARYPDDGSDANTGDLYKFADWISKLYAKHLNGDVTNFESEKWEHFDVYKMASYYIYLMRFGAVDQVVKNSMFTSEDGKHFYFIIYDNDTILGVRNDGRLVFDPTIDRQSKDPQSNDWAYAGHNSAIWNLLEADVEFMDIVKAVDDALYSAGLRYNNAINAYEGEQTSKWCEWIYNEDAELKYIGPFKKGFGVDDSGNKVTSYEAGLLSLQGNRNSHRQWWLSQRFNLYDAKFVTGTFKENNIFLKMQGAPAGLEFTITSAANVSHGYEITNGPSEISGLVGIGQNHTFAIPQAVSIGDPVVIFGATNIKKLDLSNLMPYMTEISFSKAYSETMGSTIEELCMSGWYNGDGSLKISGLEGMTSLKKMDITGMKSISSLSLPNSYNLKTLNAYNTSISSIELAPGCLIETMELPDTINRLALKELPLLTINGLKLASWNGIRELEIEDCPNLTSDFDLIWRWYDSTRDLTNRRLVLSGVSWEDVNIDRLIELVKNVKVVFTGSKNEIVLSNIEDKFKLLTLEKLFPSIPIFNKDSYLFIHSINQIFIFGPEDGIVLEGDDYQFNTIIFSDKPGTLVYDIRTGSREGVVIDKNTGLLTTVENGAASEEIIIVALFVNDDGEGWMNDYTVTIQKRVYPSNVSIVGPNRISEESTTYTWSTPTLNVTGIYDAEWSLSGDILDFVTIQYQNEKECTILRNAIPETLATGNLTLKLIKDLDKSVLTTVTIKVSVVNPNIIMTMETNPEVLTVLAKTGKITGEYLLKQDAAKFTEEDFYVDGTNSIFTSSNIKSFDEFEYFTGVKKIQSFCFSGCSNLKSIKLPNSITTIGLNAFQNTGLTYIYIPSSTTNIDLRAFIYSKYLTNIEVDRFNTMYYSIDGCMYMYTGAKPTTLFMIAPGLTSYVMPEETTGVYGDGDVTWSVGSLLQTITLNEKVKGVTGRWFMYGFSNLTEITGPERDDIKFYNGCIYNSDYSKLIYWPSGKVYTEAGLKCDESGNCLVREFGERAFSQNKLLNDFEIPQSVIKLGEWALYNTSIISLTVHENVTEIGNYCFSWNGNLKSVVINTTNVFGTNVFSTCNNLVNVKLANITSIPDAMFHGCSKLVTIDIPESVTRIGSSAFTNAGLTELTIPAGVKSIGSSCFMGCVRLGDINCLTIIAPSLGTEVFGNDSSNYTGSLATYKELHIPRSSTGYDSGDWKSVLQDKVKFTVYSDL